MSLRDLIMLLLGYGSILPALYSEFYALMVYCWLSFMKPQSLAWAESVQQARMTFIVGIILILRWMLSGAKLHIRGPSLAFFLLWLWFGVTTLTSRNMDLSQEPFINFCKIAVAVMLVTALVRTRVEIKWIMVLLAASSGLWGAKMGIFYFTTARESHEGGPMGMDSNDTAMFIAMSLPMLIFAMVEIRSTLVRRGMYLAAMLAIPAVILTTSRGGMLSLMTAIAMTIWRKTGSVRGPIAVAVVIPLIFIFAPATTTTKYQTIQNYEQDESAMGRIWAWQTSIAMAKAHPVTGVGFGQDVYLAEYPRYQVVDIDHPHAAHSVWFALLGETGYPSVFLYAYLLFQALKSTQQIMNRSIRREGRRGAWDWSYAAGIQCAMATFIVGATFLSHPRFEYVLVLAVMPVPLGIISARESASPRLEGDAQEQPKALPAVAGG